MALEKVLSMEPVKIKLKNLHEHMPNQEEVIYNFGAYLADRLGPELLPMGFCVAAQLALHDLQKGIDGYSGKPIRNKLVGYPAQVYELLNIFIPKIAKNVCPADFAKGVKKTYKEMYKR